MGYDMDLTFHEKEKQGRDYIFMKFRDFYDSSDKLTYLQVIGVDCAKGSVHTFSSFDIIFNLPKKKYTLLRDE